MEEAGEMVEEEMESWTMTAEGEKEMLGEEMLTRRSEEVEM